ncbi:hypothetical protein GCWU000325_00687 [Alloprevotella tannerae ATCC 51259]|uniref:Uncharacterized protein n=1 Tax=Alloprevotella tannerae ATCC 51259 TaxID=626522 RepID=C9LEQ6_9BACT|nr:hypothetical protein GCWU000325_00687 [Alloprevotella tannerae ATCC 51259]
MIPDSGRGKSGAKIRISAKTGKFLRIYSSFIVKNYAALSFAPSVLNR